MEEEEPIEESMARSLSGEDGEAGRSTPLLQYGSEEGSSDRDWTTPDNKDKAAGTDKGDADPGGAGEHPADPLTLRSVAVLAGASLVALLANTPAAVNVFSDKMQRDTGTSLLFMSALQGLGVAGLQFTLPTGRLLDHIGPLATTWLAMLCVGGGYAAMSWSESPALVMLSYVAVGIGSGAAFVSALTTSIAIGHPLGVASVSATMSLSISLSVYAVNEYADESGCDADRCWRNYARLFAVLCAGAFAIGSLGFLLFQREIARSQEQLRGLAASSASMGADEAREREEAIHRASIVHTPSSRQLLAEDRRPVSFASSLRSIQSRFFAAFFLANLVGYGSGTLVVTQAKQLWGAYNAGGDPAAAEWNKHITTYFSFCTAGTNVLVPLLVQFLQRHSVARRKSVLAVWLLGQGLLFLAAGSLAAAGAGASSPAARRAYVALMAATGLGFGGFLVLIPQTVGAEFPVKDFGVSIGFMQIGSAIFTVAVPSLSAGADKLAGSYNSMYFGFAVLLAVSALCVALVDLPSERRARQRPPFAPPPRLHRRKSPVV